MTTRSEVIHLGPDEGRAYDCGPTMRAVFKADGDETGDTYSISEWTLEPGCTGVGAHHHDDNDAGSFVRAPHGVDHDFRNDGDVPARFLNVYVPGGFEHDMPSIVDWYAQHPD